MNAGKNDAKRVFWKKGTCSQALCYLLDREFGYPKENEERATDPLAGGIWRRHMDEDPGLVPGAYGIREERRLR